MNSTTKFIKDLWAPIDKTAAMDMDSSSKVKSSTAFYQPQVSNVQPPELESMNTGNQQAIGQQYGMNAQQLAPQPQLIQPPQPSIQSSLPMVAKPFNPKYTGM